MKTLRNLIVLVIASTLLISCFKDEDDKITCMETYETYVTEVEGGHQVYIGAPLLLQIKIATQNGCSEVQRFIIDEDEQDIYITPELKYSICDDCDATAQDLQFEYIFKKDVPGLYRLYFKSYPDDYILHEVEVVVP